MTIDHHSPPSPLHKANKPFEANYLPTVYDKVKVDIAAEQRAQESWVGWLLALFWSIWPFAGLYGVYTAMRGGDYLLPRTSKIGAQKSKIL